MIVDQFVDRWIKAFPAMHDATQPCCCMCITVHCMLPTIFCSDTDLLSVQSGSIPADGQPLGYSRTVTLLGEPELSWPWCMQWSCQSCQTWMGWWRQSRGLTFFWEAPPASRSSPTGTPVWQMSQACRTLGGLEWNMSLPLHEY